MAPKTVYRALLVDDSEDVRTLLRRSFEQYGMLCDEAADGIMAENQMRRTRYDVLIADLIMPRKHGHKLIVETLEREHPPMIVAITGMLEPKIVTDLISRGVTDVVQKPILWAQFTAKIHAMLERQTMLGLGRHHIGPAQQKTTDHATSPAGIDIHIDYGNLILRLMQRFNMAACDHVKRVETVSSALAERAGLRGKRLAMLRAAALFHEIGYCAPSPTTGRPLGECMNDEKLAYQRYPVEGARMLANITGADEIAELVATHAENVDGTGFPERLRAEQIPLEAKIIRIADGCDMVMLQSESTPSIQQHLMQCRDKAYDPALTDLALAYFNEPGHEIVAAGTEQRRVAQLALGDVLAQNVYDAGGRFLAKNGAVINEPLLNQLQRYLADEKVRVHSSAH